MYKELLKRSRLQFLLMIFGFPLIAIGELENSGKSEAPPLPWQSSFQLFIDEVSRVCARVKAPNAKELETRSGDLASMSDGGGFVIDVNPPKGTRQWEINRVFAGKSFHWSVPIAKVSEPLVPLDNVSHVIPDLDYEKEPTQDSYPPKGVYVEIRGVKSVKEGESIEVKGTLGKSVKGRGKHLLSGVCVINLTERDDGAYDLLLVLNGKLEIPRIQGAE